MWVSALPDSLVVPFGNRREAIESPYLWRFTKITRYFHDSEPELFGATL